MGGTECDKNCVQQINNGVYSEDVKKSKEQCLNAKIFDRRTYEGDSGLHYYDILVWRKYQKSDGVRDGT